MKTITSSDLQRQIGTQLDAVQREPIVITSNRRPRAVLVSVDEFRRLMALSEKAGPADGDK